MIQLYPCWDRLTCKLQLTNIKSKYLLRPLVWEHGCWWKDDGFLVDSPYRNEWGLHRVPTSTPEVNIRWLTTPQARYYAANGCSEMHMDYRKTKKMSRPGYSIWMNFHKTLVIGFDGFDISVPTGWCLAIPIHTVYCIQPSPVSRWIIFSYAMVRNQFP
jgi:hypothetical protein